jgi:hypothetical protein
MPNPVAQMTTTVRNPKTPWNKAVKNPPFRTITAGMLLITDLLKTPQAALDARGRASPLVVHPRRIPSGPSIILESWP